MIATNIPERYTKNTKPNRINGNMKFLVFLKSGFGSAQVGLILRWCLSHAYVCRDLQDSGCFAYIMSFLPDIKPTGDGIWKRKKPRGYEKKLCVFSVVLEKKGEENPESLLLNMGFTSHESGFILDAKENTR